MSRRPRLQDLGGLAPGHPRDEVAVPRKLRRFHGQATLDPHRVATGAGKIAEEVIQHLSAQLGSEVEISLEIHADMPGGVSDQIRRTVEENCRTLGFKVFGFEEE